MQKLVNKSALFLLTLSLSLVLTEKSFATVYECSPQQTYVWKNGALKSISARKEVMRFDDEKSVLWDAASSTDRFVPTHFEIVQKISPDNDLVALATIVVNGHFIGNEAIRIRSWDKTTSSLVFLYTSGEGISSGHCHESASTLGEQLYK